MRLRIAFIVLPLIAVLIAGCGSDGGSSSSDSSAASGDEGSAPLSKAAFIKQGDAVCAQVPTQFRKALKELEKERQAAGKPPTVPPAESTTKAVVPALPEAVQGLEELDPPKGDEQQAEAIVAALAAAQKEFEEDPSAPLLGPKSPF